MARPALNAFSPRWYNWFLSSAPYIVVFGIFLILPFFVGTFFETMIIKIFIFTIFAMSCDLILGYTGLPTLGHAAYFGVAAYTTGIMTVRYGVEIFWIVFPAAIFMAMLVAILFGLVALRVSGIYFLLVTFALGEVLFHVAWSWRSMTGGSDGLPAIPIPDFGLPWLTNITYFWYYFAFMALVVCFLLLRRIVKSPFGRTLKGIRENEARMATLGFNTWRHKYVAFIIGALFAGVAGVLFAYSYGFVVAGNLGIETSTLAMFMVIIGGGGTLFGSLIGSSLILLLEYFASIYIPERWPFLLGLVFIAASMYFRGGIGIHLLRWWEKVNHRYGSTKG